MANSVSPQVDLVFLRTKVRDSVLSVVKDAIEVRKFCDKHKLSHEAFNYFVELQLSSLLYQFANSHDAAMAIISRMMSNYIEEKQKQEQEPQKESSVIIPAPTYIG